jgi:glycine/D-amino acid oxidase-like deaminating enzyme
VTADTIDPGRHRSYWLREALSADPGEPCPPLTGDTRADVVIIGGGYTGLWTAYFLKERNPAVDVVVLEADICGGGPSGRNGGFLTGWWDELPALVELYGEDAAIRACRAMGKGVHAVGEWIRRHDVDAWFTDGGYLQVSASPDQDGAWSDAVAACTRSGADQELVELTAGQVRARCASPVFRAGVLMRDGATVQPARLVRGLRRVVLERGVRIHEGSPVKRFAAGSPVRAVTPAGEVIAGRAVLAINAWAAGWRQFRRSIVTWSSYIVLTAPAPELLQKVGWTGGECITDSRTSVRYFRTTPDGRIAMGGGGGRAGAGSRIGRAFTHDRGSANRAAEGLRWMFPTFDRVPIEDAWGGPIDVSGLHLPFFGTLPAGTVHYGLGYTGNGVAPSYVGGRVLSGLALDIEDEATTLPVVHADPKRFPPEPLRSIGAHLVRGAIIRRERAAERGDRVGPVTDLAATLPGRLGYRLGPERSPPGQSRGIVRR